MRGSLSATPLAGDKPGVGPQMEFYNLQLNKLLFFGVKAKALL